jgi:hypothetical protein
MFNIHWREDYMRLIGKTLLWFGEHKHFERIDLVFTDAKPLCNLPKIALWETLKGERKEATFKSFWIFTCAWTGNLTHRKT